MRNTVKVLGVIVFAAICAFMFIGCSDDSAWTSEPSVPANLVATAISQSSIVITWPGVSGALQYYVYMSETDYNGSFDGPSGGNNNVDGLYPPGGSYGNSDPYTRLGVVTAAVNGNIAYSYTATSLSKGTNYYFKVSAVNEWGESGRSQSVSAYTLTSYTVTFDRNGGTGTVPSPITVNQGQRITLPSPTYLNPPAGSTSFWGWSENSSGSGTFLNPGDSYTPRYDTVLYARWGN